MKTTINPINFDLINDKVEILIGGKRNKWVTGEMYRALRKLADNSTSGLRRVRTYNYNRNQNTLYFNEANVVRNIEYSGNVQCELIKMILA